MLSYFPDSIFFICSPLSLRCLSLSLSVFTHLNCLLTLVKVKSESRSVVSISLQPHGLYSPWNSLGQNTGVGSLSLLQGIFPTQGRCLKSILKYVLSTYSLLFPVLGSSTAAPSQHSTQDTKTDSLPDAKAIKQKEEIHSKRKVPKEAWSEEKKALQIDIAGNGIGWWGRSYKRERACVPPNTNVRMFPLNSGEHCSVTQSCLTLQPCELQHAKHPCPSLSPGVCLNHVHLFGDAI